MKFAFVTRTNEISKWGGDLKALYSIGEGMQLLGHEVDFVQTTADLSSTDHVFLSSTSMDLRPDHNLLKLQGKDYSLLAFHEDTIQYFGATYGFFFYVRKAINGEEDEGFPFCVERLYENPDIIHYYNVPPRKSSYVNYHVLKDARVCFANSSSECRTMLRDCPTANAKVVHLSPGFAEEHHGEISDDFLKLTGLKKGEYILQVGRFEVRKNQLGSILATKDLDIPLVFIATKTDRPWYEGTCLEAIRKWRKGPTFIISETLSDLTFENIKIIQMPNKEKLSAKMLISAYANAALHLHPAFYELPGYTYLEAAKLGIPTVASSWATIDDYFTDSSGKYSLDERIEYCLPYHLPSIKKLILKKIGQKFSKDHPHPIFKRTKLDVASEVLQHLNL